MASINQELFFIRLVGTQSSFLSGYGKYAVPKLYTKSSAGSVASKKNNENEKYNLKNRYEVVPVTITIGEPNGE